MSFLEGRASFARFRICSVHARDPIGDRHIQCLADNAIGKQRTASNDGSDFGWIAGDHILDTDFLIEKNVIDGCLAFSLRYDCHRAPANLLKAYYQTELKALSKDNPSGFPSARQKREARAAARDRLDEEMADGRFLKRAEFPCLWDAQSGELFASITNAQLPRLMELFRTAFGPKLELLSSGPQMAAIEGRESQVRDTIPSLFIPGTSPDEIRWVLGDDNRDFLGNEYLLWLWFMLRLDDWMVELSRMQVWMQRVERKLASA